MSDIGKIWKHFDELQKDITLYLINGNPPISIDDLLNLSGAPAIKVLSILEMLRKKRIVCERKGYEKGHYFLANQEFANFVERLTPIKDTKRAIKALIEYYVRVLNEGTEKTLILAELYRKLGDMEQGLHFIKDGADILFRSKDEEKALVYYHHILEYFENMEPTEKSASIFVESVLAKLSLLKELRPYHEQMVLLRRAEQVAGRFKRWELLARIKLELASELLVGGETKQGAVNVANFRKLARKVNDPAMLKKAALAMSELCFWQGRILDATRSYEEVVEDLEEFGKDEMTLRHASLVGWCYVMCGRIARGIGMINTVRTKAQLLGFERIAYIADIIKVHALLDVRKISEAEAILDSNARPHALRDSYDHIIAYEAALCRAYILYAKEDYEGAFACHEEAAKGFFALGWIPRTNPWDFERLGAMESRGFFLENMNYQAEMERAVNGTDIYIKGFALRYRALANMEKFNFSPVEVLVDLKSSEKYLKECGAEIELARTRLALGNCYLKKRDDKAARSYLEKAWQFFSTVDRNLFPSDLMAIMPKEEKIEFMINRIGDTTRSLGMIRDRSSFLDSALNVAMDFTMAMRGAFLTLESDDLKIVTSRNLDLLFLNTGDFEVTKQIILEAYQEIREVVIPVAKDSDRAFYKAIQIDSITTLVGIPVKFGDHLYGYLVLDNRLDGTPFPKDNLPLLRILCDQVAVGLSNINIYNEMKELKENFEQEASFYKQEMGITAPLEMIIGKSEAIHKMTHEIRQVANTDSSVLILGETGVGKELVAKAVHGLSNRKNGPFIPVNLAAIPQELIPSELFGHEQGAFTGAKERQKGRFELADGGAIFLDEIGDLSLNVQVKLLRVLQEGTFERLGSSKPIRSDFRVISATNKDLRREVEKGIFRQDLFYRLNVFPIYLPPLRERKEDIPLLAHFFLDKFCKKAGKDIRRIPSDEMKKLMTYHWPGNVRELEHFIERAVVLSGGQRVSFTGFEFTSSDRMSTENTGPLSTLADVEREHIERVLNDTNWKVSGPYGAASILGLKSSTLVFRMKKMGIKRP